MALVLSVKLMGKVDIGPYTLRVVGLLGPEKFVGVLKQGDREIIKKAIGFKFENLVDDIHIGAGKGSDGSARVIIKAPPDVKVLNRKKWRFTDLARDQWDELIGNRPLVELIRAVKRSEVTVTKVGKTVYYNRRYGDLLVTEENRLIRAVALAPGAPKICPYCWNTGKVPQWDDTLISEVMLPCTCRR